jgi:histidyl-tRNA synthetase
MEVTKETLQLLFDSLGLTDNLIYVLIIVLLLNIIATVVKFFLDRQLQNREKKVHKQRLLIENSIKVQEKIYRDMEKLSTFTQSETNELLQEIASLQKYVTNNGIYITKGMSGIINNTLDYFRVVLTDFRLKDYKREASFFEDYAKEFNK